ncbi:radical SAM protein [Nannocystaceae bacterium ST9]
MNRTAILYIAERCNQKCVFCLEEDGEWSEFVDPTTQQVYDVLDRLHGRGGRHITFMGGETFFRKDLPRIIARAKQVGFTRVGVTTNGTVLSKPGFIANLTAAGLDFIELSVHAHDEALANRISRNKVTFDRQAKAMAEIDETGSLFTIVNVVICRENKDHLIDVARYVSETLAHVPVKFKFKFVSLQGWALDRARGGEQAPLRYDEVDFIALSDFLRARGAAFWFYNVPLCHLGEHAIRSHELGVVSIDERYFDMDHRGPNEYYDSGHQLEGRLWPSASCAECSTLALCPGIEESYRLANGGASLHPRSDDPLALVRWALADRKGDPDHAERRLAELRELPRPTSFIRNRPEGALRFKHPDEALPFDLTVDPRADDKPGFALTEHFVLGYRSRSEADRQPAAQVLALLERAARILADLDAAGATLEQTRTAIMAAPAEGWVAELQTVAARPDRKRGKLAVLQATAE